jgi:hypothetical protein
LQSQEGTGGASKAAKTGDKEKTVKVQLEAHLSCFGMFISCTCIFLNVRSNASFLSNGVRTLGTTKSWQSALLLLYEDKFELI